MENFTTSTKALKTFYSLQRANRVNLYNTDIVLLGAVDLVEEGDATIYSINRIDELYLNDGSTVKLDQIVKYLGEITSDYEFVEGDNTPERKFINHGNNGKNYYGDYITNSAEALTEEEIAGYREEEYNANKNVICVANGLYLEIIRQNNEYFIFLTGKPLFIQTNKVILQQQH